MTDDWGRSRQEVAQYQVGSRVHGRVLGSAGLQREAEEEAMSVVPARLLGATCCRHHPPPPALAPSAPTQHEHPDSILAANISACCDYRAGGPSAALHCLCSLPAQLPPGGGSPGGALVLHNAVVFGDGAGGMQVRKVQRQAALGFVRSCSLLHCQPVCCP